VVILLAVPIGIAVGYLMGGRLDRLEKLRFRWAWLAVAGLAVQVVLFSGLLDDVITGGLGGIVYVASTAAVLIAVLRNVRVPGMPLIALGAVANLAPIIANGGVMPTTLAAMEAAGLPPTEGFSNSAVLEDPALAPLTDIYALPPWMPFHNVFSLGDVLIAAGIVVVIAAGMRRGAASN
jgi:hypothetical protein